MTRKTELKHKKRTIDRQTDRLTDRQTDRPENTDTHCYDRTDDYIDDEFFQKKLFQRLLPMLHLVTFPEWRRKLTLWRQMSNITMIWVSMLQVSTLGSMTKISPAIKGIAR